MMQVGKTYILNPRCEELFIKRTGICGANRTMVEILRRHGPSFVVDELKTYTLGEKSVSSVTMEDGTVFKSQESTPGKYFEIFDDEFEFFVNVSPQTFLKPTSYTFEVNENNVHEVIAEIKSTFGV
ncbi:hypothetical protein A71_152 [Escherichia phage A7_1]|uniref:Uncharacterized protein n=1 Tax=Escherichia phage A5-4 TaxID=2996162 RepID=A0A9Y1E0P6_9CAUD|nr:hypothetical protein A71_152 [Escherichia phage A7_1]UZZ64232.1 hypothetical protein A54_268 [Escherichia phage A5-4]